MNRRWPNFSRGVWRKKLTRGVVPDRCDGLRNEAGQRVLTPLPTRDKEGQLIIAAIDFQQESSRQERSGQKALRPAVHLVWLCARSCRIVLLVLVVSLRQVRPHLRSHTLRPLLPPFHISDTRLE